MKKVLQKLKVNTRIKDQTIMWQKIVKINIARYIRTVVKIWGTVVVAGRCACAGAAPPAARADMVRAHAMHRVCIRALLQLHCNGSMQPH